MNIIRNFKIESAHFNAISLSLLKTLQEKKMRKYTSDQRDVLLLDEKERDDSVKKEHKELSLYSFTLSVYVRC